MSETLNDIARKLAANAANHGGNVPPVITLSGFYHPKYDTYHVNFRVNDSVCTINLDKISTKLGRIFPECREVYRLAIIELDRMLKGHYVQEDLLRKIIPVLHDEALRQEITDVLAIKGDEK